ncbi:DUF1801 domain-containing protein [Paenibacillus harenae]|uniref:YdhG-like domain-containing protein n=1 Tax=Paenibacillus harenae TaxID=306543 RepID=A0ABT9TYG9_PAEHA|nr:DUF1801 domain-containing protein [Paenibacillus harenae]MDQ0112386.1 hypothetical protein [Paenibacillus harenae]
MAANKRSGEELVDEFMDTLEHPLKDAIVVVRRLILKVNENITEHIKWNAPSFCVNNEDRITFNLQGKGFFRLVFHTGAKAKQNTDIKPLIEDPTGLLEWVATDRAIIKLMNLNDVELKKNDLVKVVAKWVEVTG